MKTVAFTFLAISAAAMGCKTRNAELAELDSLPNQAFADIYHTDHEAGLYDNIIEKLGQQNWNFAVNLKALKIDWPLQDTKTTVLTRFSTPSIVNVEEEGSPQNANWFVYLHEGVDIARSQTNVSADARAPVSGQAIILQDIVADEDEAKKTPTLYDMAVVIYDEKSHAVVSLLHVAPAANLKTDSFTQVKVGEVIGTLAPIAEGIIPNDPRLQHVHLSVLDLHKQMMINPMMHIAKYNDKVAPKLHSAFLLNEDGEKITHLTDGSIDIVIEASDRDRDSDRPFEIAAIDFEVRDQNNKVLLSAPDCDISRFNEKNVVDILDSREALTLGNAMSDGKPAPASQDRSYRYVITNLKPNGNDSGCDLLADERGFLPISESTQKIKVRVRIYDHMGNSTREEFEFKRNQTAS